MTNAPLFVLADASRNPCLQVTRAQRSESLSAISVDFTFSMVPCVNTVFAMSEYLGLVIVGIGQSSRDSVGVAEPSELGLSGAQPFTFARLVDRTDVSSQRRRRGIRLVLDVSNLLGDGAGLKAG